VDPRRQRVEVLLLDLGGVLLELNDPAVTFGFDSDPAAFFHAWIRSPAVRDLESGAIDAESFAHRFLAESALPCGQQEFLDRFERWPNQLYAEIPALLDKLGQRYRLGLLSNTNSYHWDLPEVGSRLEGKFEKVLLSFRTGKLKPDLDAFAHAFESFGCAPERIAFFDDNPANIDGARQAGCHAFLTKGPDSLIANLELLESGSP
jgi:HAD superfamily hydrolase (TIGR01509 family)